MSAMSTCNRVVYQCPVCRNRVRPYIAASRYGPAYGDPNAVDTEDDDGRITWYHRTCYDAMLDGGEQ